MNLIHPLTGVKSEASVTKNNSGEYTKIVFPDGYKITNVDYVYDILFENDIITLEEYNYKNWELIREYVSEI